MNVLDVEVSFFEKANEPGNPKNGRFLEIVKSEKLAKKYLPTLNQIRAEEDKKKRAELKKHLPVLTPSGVFSYRAEENLVKHSGLVVFDIDPADNPGLDATTAPAWRDEISKLANVAYCGISASGKGVWGVIPILDPEQHKPHFDAIVYDFARRGIVLDKANRDTSRARFWSYDPQAKIRTDAEVYTKTLYPQRHEPRQSEQRWNNERPQDLAQQAAEYLIQNRVPLECTYANFMRIAFACKHEWGDAGKDIALDILHACTTFAISDTARKFDTLWRNIKRDSGKVTTAGTLVNIAKEAGFRYQSKTAYTTPNAHSTTQAPPPAPITTGHRIEQFTSRLTGETFSQEIDESGLPAAWGERQKATAIMAADFVADDPIKFADDEDQQWSKAKQRAKELADWYDNLKPWINTGPLATVRVTAR